MHVDGAVERFPFAAAEVLVQLVAGADPALAAREGEEQVELGRGEGQGAVVQGGGVGFRRDAQRAGDHLAQGFGGALLRGPAGTAQQGAQAGQQFARGKRLGQIVVGAQLQSDHAVDLLAPAGEHQHRHLALPADPTQHLESVDVRQHHVQDDGVPGLGHRPGRPGSAELLGLHGKAERLKVVGGQLAEILVIVDDQDAKPGPRSGRAG